MPPKELDSLLLLLNERKQKLDREEAEINTEIIFDFLHRLQFRKLEAMKEVSSSDFFASSVLRLNHFNSASFFRFHGYIKCFS